MLNSYDMAWSEQPRLGSLGLEPITTTIALVGAVSSFIKLLKSTGKRAREDFFEARDFAAEKIFLAFANQAGYDFDAMMNYWLTYNDSNRKLPMGPERGVVDKWMAELNAKKIGGDAASAANLSAQSISFKNFDFAYPLLQQAVESFASKYMSGGSQTIPPKSNLSTNDDDEKKKQASVVTPEGRTILIVTGSLAGLLLITAGLKHFKVI